MSERCSVCEVMSLELTDVYDDVGVRSWLCSWCFTNGFFLCCQVCERFSSHVVSGDEWCAGEFGPAPPGFDVFRLWCRACVARVERERVGVLAGLDERTRRDVLGLSGEWGGSLDELIRVVRAL